MLQLKKAQTYGTQSNSANIQGILPINKLLKLGMKAAFDCL